MSQLKLWLAVLLCTASVGGARAATVVYDEAVSGDIDGFDLGTLPLGASTVLGTVTFSNNRPISSDLDNFRFSIARRDVLSSVTFSATLLPEGAGTFSSAQLQLVDNLVDLVSDGLPIPADGISVFGKALALEADDYILRFASIGGSLTSGEYRRAAYGIDLTVAPIPLPAGFWLSFAASSVLAGAGWMRRAKPLAL